MWQANPTWGSPRIVLELRMLGIDVAKSTVEEQKPKSRKPPSPTWKTFLKQHAHELVSIDFFVVPTATFKVLFAFVVLAQDRRRIVHLNVTEHPTAQWTAQQLTEACPFDTAPASPWPNAYVERLIGSIRRDLLDHVVILSERQLRRLLSDYLITTTPGGRISLLRATLRIVGTHD
jgi:putative transposase